MRWYLRRVPLLRGFAPEVQDRLADSATRRDLRRREPVFIEGDAADRVYFTCGGRVRSTLISSGGKVVTLAHYGPGELFGEGCLASDKPREHSVWTTTPAIVADLPAEIFVGALRDDPDAVLRFAALVGRRHQALAKRLGDLVLHDVKARLAGLLLELAREFGRESEDGTVIEVARTHHEMANDIATTRETLSTMLGGFVRAGLVMKQGRFLVVIDAPRLRATAGVDVA